MRWAAFSTSYKLDFRNDRPNTAAVSCAIIIHHKKYLSIDFIAFCDRETIKSQGYYHTTTTLKLRTPDTCNLTASVQVSSYLDFFLTFAVTVVFARIWSCFANLRPLHLFRPCCFCPRQRTAWKLPTSLSARSVQLTWLLIKVVCASSQHFCKAKKNAYAFFF